MVALKISFIDPSVKAAIIISALTNSYFLLEHYKSLAVDYDRFQQAQSRAIANFIHKLVQLSADDQIIDVAGGTAQISLMVKDDLGMTRPVVCIDPSEEMLDVARRNGALAIQSTAEEFFAAKPEFPLRVIFMNGCVHHFEKPEFIFSQMASYMPEGGVCVVCKYPPNTTLPFFKAAKDAYSKAGDRLEDVHKLIDFKSMGLECRKVLGVERGEVDKALWYESLRKRLASFLAAFSDRELEEGIEELEEEFKDQTRIKLDITIKALVLTKTNSQLEEKS